MRLRSAARLLPLLLLLADAAAPAPAAAPVPQPLRPDVVLVTIDTLRADALGFAGNRRVATPNLDRLAAAGRVFINAHAHNVVTLPSHTNILTGLYPFQHGVRDNSGFALPASVATMASVLHDAGYATGGFVGAYPLDSRFGLDHGFEVYDDRTTTGAGEEQLVLAERRGDEVVSAALAWWKASAGKPRFLWTHLYDPHASYQPPEPFATRYAKEPYLGEVAAVDSFLGPLLLPHLEGREPPCFVVLTGDHGEALGEHGEETHGLFAYEATLHVPLVLWGRGVAAGIDARPARHVDIFPTVLAAAGAAAPAGGPQRPGRSLLQPWSDGPDSYFEAMSAALNRGWAPLRGLLRQSPNGEAHKYIALPLPEAYDLPRDPGELRNLVDADRRAARAAFDALPPASAWPPPARGAVGGEEQARMLALGYAASVTPTKSTFGPEDDPKRLVALDRKIHQLTEAYSRGDVDAAITLARDLVAARPMPLGHSLLANALLEAGRTGEALQVMEKARASGLAADTLLRQLGLTLAEVGRTAEAVAVLQPLADRGDVGAMNNLALAHSEAGRQRDAFLLLQQVLAKDADNAKALEVLGLVELRLGHWPQARDASRRAVQRRAGLAHAWNNLGVASYQLGDVPAALDAWKQAVDREPELWDALWNLGLEAAAAKRADLAVPALRRFAAEAPADRYREERARARALLAQLGAGAS
ncbi:MAG TPA: sulfatase-like hydrolase/transferase [Thermoanaerobaculia bacterium]|jgi:arylsulfatase A-like enzyme/tetratricopeptide (TPR) repeat protein|nr:sulfatase-like hydrolase/transferase [Thermoanaerobaculia bacterium]